MAHRRRGNQRGPWTCKPLSIVLRGNFGDSAMLNHTEDDPQRHMGFWDLVSIGVGGTVGSGIFVLAGVIAHRHAGPSTWMSFALSGLAASCSGLSYAEWAARIPVAGSTYLYSLVSLGEMAAVVAGACLTLEYGVSGAAVARSCADKVLEFYHSEKDGSVNNSEQSSSFNPLAGLISLLAVALLSFGVEESKRVTNFFTALKVALVVVMIVGGLSLFDLSNILRPSILPFGFSGVLRGATSSFFAFLAYDEVCCLSAEAKNPSDVPKAVLATLGIVTSLYILAALALVGMCPFNEISETSAFPSAFAGHEGWEWAGHVTAVGEIITLPVVVVISFLAQPRLFCAMAEDGLMPSIFSRRSQQSGSLFWSNLICGIPMAVLATFVPFRYLDDGISVGILVAFNMTNTSLILMKCDGPTASLNHPVTAGSQPPVSFVWLTRNLFGFHGLSIINGLVSSKISSADTNADGAKFHQLLPVSSCFLTVVYALYIHGFATKQAFFGALSVDAEKRQSQVMQEDSHNDEIGNRANGLETSICPPILSTSCSFETPLVPFLPLLGIALNWFLVAQLELSGLLLLLGYVVLVAAFYWGGCRSFAQYRPWFSDDGRIEYDNNIHHSSFQESKELQPILLRELSLPKR